MIISKAVRENSEAHYKLIQPERKLSVLLLLPHHIRFMTMPPLKLYQVKEAAFSFAAFTELKQLVSWRLSLSQKCNLNHLLFS